MPDANGNLSAKTAPLPNQTGASTVTINYAYDVLNRLTGKTYKDGTVTDPYTTPVLYGYDGVALTGCTKAPPSLPDTYPIGRRTSMCDGSGSTSWDHDPMGRILQDERFIGGIAAAKFVNYGYDLAGDLAYLTTPPIKTLAYSYDIGTGISAGRPIRVLDTTDTITFATGATYAPPGEVTGLTVGGISGFAGFAITNAYNNRMQPILLSAKTATATVFSECFDFHLGVAVNTPPCVFNASTAGDNGNVYQIKNNRDSNRTQNFLYDSLNRIQQAYSNGTNWGETFSPTQTAAGVAPTTPGIDSWGNLTNRSGVTNKTNTELFSCPANTKNQLTTCSLTYDAAGNVTQNGSATYVYDAENRLIATSGISYVYDGDGERREKCTEGNKAGLCATGATGTLYWRNTAGEVLDETDLAGNTQEEYIYFGGQRIARRTVDSSGNTVALHYYFSDHLGSHGVVENINGTACEQDIDYYPYGGLENDYCTTPVAQHYKFTSKERDTESGLDHFGARYDASSMGRFMTPDWAANPEDVPYANFGNPQSLNLYSYALNNPLKLVDIDGHDLVVAASLQNIVNKLRTESASFNAELAAHEGPNSPNLTFTSGSTPNDVDGSPTIGNTSAPIGGGPVTDCRDGACSPLDRPYTYKGATVTVNDSVMGDKGETEDVIKHETGHVHDARTNTDQYHKDNQNTQQTKGKTPGCIKDCHNKRPEEQRADQFKDKTNQEKKQWEKDHCHGFFHKTCNY
jgi:RHS repeat-associated protein